jgi:hypothetical protein
MEDWNMQLGCNFEWGENPDNCTFFSTSTDRNWKILSEKLKGFKQYNINSCQDCKFLNGGRYEGKYLICGSHPYGWPGNNCPDWEDKN